MVRHGSRARLVPILALMMSALVAMALGVGGGAAVAQGATASVSIAGFAFAPATIQITAGTTVTWTNNDQVAHTVTADDGSFDSGDIQPGGMFSMTFDTPGTIAYHCAVHPNMTASIVVMAAANDQTATTATQPAVASTTAAETPAASLPVTGVGSSLAPATSAHGLAALALGIVAMALGLLATVRTTRRR